MRAGSSLVCERGDYRCARRAFERAWERYDRATWFGRNLSWILPQQDRLHLMERDVRMRDVQILMRRLQAANTVSVWGGMEEERWL